MEIKEEDTSIEVISEIDESDAYSYSVSSQDPEDVVRHDYINGEAEDIEIEYESWEMLEGMWFETLAANFEHEVMWKCLQFCYLFPKNCEFYQDDIVQLWMAQGSFLSSSAQENTLRLYFVEFERGHIFRLSRFDPSTRQSRYRLNHSIVDLLQEESNDDYFRLGDANSSISENVVHASFLDSRIDSVNVKKLYQAKQLRTLMIFHEPGYQLEEVTRELFLKLPSLMILDLSCTSIKELPSSIGKLKDLRYLNLSETPITTLPDSLCSLYQLQTLKLWNCLELVGLPDDMRKLKNLRHLDLDQACLLVSMPPGFGDLTQLQSLPAFVVGKENGYHITELRHMVNIRGTLRILRLENVSSLEEAKEAALDTKVHLQNLELQWTELQDGPEVLENLKPHTEIQELHIVGYGGSKFPSWIGDPFFSRLMTISIHDCRKCEFLPPLGKLPLLSDLCISEMHEVKVIDHQFCGRDMDANFVDLARRELGMVADDLNSSNRLNAFPRLEKLTLNGLPKLEKWIGMEDGDFPHLQKLTLSGCSKLASLTKLPILESLHQLVISFCHSLESFPNEGLPASLQYLAIVDCPWLKERFQNDREENYRMLTRIPNVWIDYQQFFPVTAFRQTQNMGNGSPSFHSVVSVQTQEDSRPQAGSLKQITRENLLIVLPSRTDLLSRSLKQKELMHHPTSSSFDIPPQTSKTGSSSKQTPQVEEQVHVEDTGLQQHSEGNQRWVDPTTETGPPPEGGNNWRTLKWSNISRILSMMVPRRKNQSRNNTQSREFEISRGGTYMHLKTQPKAFETLSDEKADSPGATIGSSSNEAVEWSINNPKRSQNTATGSLKEEFPKFRVYTLAELESASSNFRQDLILGEEAFGRVYEGWIDGSHGTVIIKKASFESMQSLGDVWQSEVDYLGRLSHPNLVKLLGYCREEKQFLFVYEYMQNGSLENHLFREGRFHIKPLPWDIRLKIAIGVAGGLAFWHASGKQVIHLDLKASNILLDGNYNAKLSDFGLTRVRGTHWYPTPEHGTGGYIWDKGGVYGFALILLELLTGCRAVDPEQALPMLLDLKVLWFGMDPLLDKKYPVKAAFKAAQLVQKCVEVDPENRPSMEEVLETLVHISTIDKKTRGIWQQLGLPYSSNEVVEEAFPNGQIWSAPKHRVYTLAELKSATRNFRPDLLLGGGAIPIYKGWIDESLRTVSVKKVSFESIKFSSEELQFQADFYGRLSHPNLVKLLGYCWEEKECLLVYEFMEKGSLENHLLAMEGYSVEPLTWNLRLKIAIGAAHGLVFLYASKRPILYSDFMVSDILLDGNYNAKLSDYSCGYGSINGYPTTKDAARDYIFSRGAVYAFGVVLLQLLIGVPTIDTKSPGGQHSLVDWAMPLLLDRKKLMTLMNSRLHGQFPVKAAVQAARLVHKCLHYKAKSRPLLKEVLVTLVHISTIED